MVTDWPPTTGSKPNKYEDPLGGVESNGLCGCNQAFHASTWATGACWCQAVVVDDNKWAQWWAAATSQLTGTAALGGSRDIGL